MDTTALRREVASYGVRVCTVEPGFVDTALTSFINDENRQDDLSKTQLKEICETAAAQTELIRKMGMIKPELVADVIAKECFRNVLDHL